jgi:hypothetical protein
MANVFTLPLLSLKSNNNFCQGVWGFPQLGSGGSQEMTPNCEPYWHGARRLPYHSTIMLWYSSPTCLPSAPSCSDCMYPIFMPRFWCFPRTDVQKLLQSPFSIHAAPPLRAARVGHFFTARIFALRVIVSYGTRDTSRFSTLRASRFSRTPY